MLVIIQWYKYGCINHRPLTIRNISKAVKTREHMCGAHEMSASS